MGGNNFVWSILHEMKLDLLLQQIKRATSMPHLGSSSLSFFDFILHSTNLTPGTKVAHSPLRTSPEIQSRMV